MKSNTEDASICPSQSADRLNKISFTIAVEFLRNITSSYSQNFHRKTNVKNT